MKNKINLKTHYITHAFSVFLLFFLSPSANAAMTTNSQNSVYIEDLTSPEIADMVKAGYTTVIIPTGGSEQNHAHMIIGKHNKIMYFTSGEIAKKLGKTLVTPVLAYVPEGNMTPPEGHMNFAGTLSLREETFSAVLEDTASSLKQHGFKLICFVGDHGGNQAPQQKLADKLSAQWKADGVRVLQVSDYYANNEQDAWVATLKLPIRDPAAHAGFEDSSELLAVDADGIRKNLLISDAAFASAEYGKKLLDLKIEAAVKQIKNSQSNNAKP